MGSNNRRRTCQITIRLDKDEKIKIQELAAQVDLTVPSYLRNVGLNYEPESNLDAKAIEQLAKLHGDIGRVGGLLKLWLSKKSLKKYGESLNVPDLVTEILKLQKEIGEVAKRL